MSLVDTRNIPLTDNEKYEALQAKKSGMTTTVLPTAVEENFSQYSSVGGLTPLMQACQQGHESSVRQLLHKDSRIVHERDRTGKTALHYCAENSSLTCIDQILAADPSLLSARDEDGYTPLHLATISGNRSVVRYLLTKGSDVHATDNEKHTAIHWAAVCGEVELLELLIESGGNPSTPDIHGAYPIHYAAQMCGPNSELGQDVQTGLQVLQKLLQYGVDVSVKDQDGRQPILWAASAEVRPSHVYCPSGSADAILALVNAGADVTSDDKDGLTALHCAASRGHLDCLDVLITLCSAEVDTLDANGCTPLFYAATLGHADCTDLLLKHGSVPDRQDRKGRTPAHCGAAKGQLETLKLLHKRGADLWKRNVKGDLPLHEAVQSGRKDLVMWLLSLQPISVNAPNNDGRCLLHIAAINNNTEMCKIIMDYKASVNPIMRNSRGQLLTPVDAAVARGNKGCAKYLQLHGGLPAIRLTDKRALQAAMQRALEFEPTGHTGATPSDLMGDLTESSSPTTSKTPFFLEIPPALMVPKDESSDGGRSSSSIGLQMGYPYEHIDSGSQTEGGTPGLTRPEMFTSDSYIRDLILKEEQMMMTDKIKNFEEGTHSEFEKGETVVTIENQNLKNESLIQKSEEESDDTTTAMVDSVSKIMTNESESPKAEDTDHDSGESVSKDGDHELEQHEERDNTENDLLVNGNDDGVEDSEDKSTENISTNAQEKSVLASDEDEEIFVSEVNQTNNEKQEMQSTIMDTEHESDVNASAFNRMENENIEVAKINDMAEVSLKSEENDITNEGSLTGSEVVATGKRKLSKEKVSDGKKETSEAKIASKKVSLETKKEDKITYAENNPDKRSSKKSASSLESSHSEDSLGNSFPKDKKSLLMKDSKGSSKKSSAKIKKLCSKSQSEDKILKENDTKHSAKRISDSKEVPAALPRELGDGASEDGESLANADDSLLKKGTRTKILKKKSSSKISNGPSKITQSTSDDERSSSEFTPSPDKTNEDGSEYNKDNLDSSSHSSVETVLPFQNGDLKNGDVSSIEDERTHELLLSTSTVVNNIGLVQDVPADNRICTPKSSKQRKSILKRRPKNERTHELHLSTTNGENNIGLVEDVPASSVISTPKVSKKDIAAMEKRSLDVNADQPANDSSENSEEDVNKGRVKNRRKIKKSKQKTPQRNEDGSLQQSDDSSYETSNENMQEEASSKAIKKKRELASRKIDMDTEKERLLKDFNHREEKSPEDAGEVALKDVDQNIIKIKEIRKRTTTKRGKSVKIDVGKRPNEDLKEDIKEAGRRVMSGGPKKVESIDSNMKKKRSALSLPMDMSVTRAMQTTVRKYALERRLFQQLLDLKRMQIRNSRANEHMLIKRMIDEYGNDEMIGLKSYVGAYNFANYEKYLYDQLRTLQATDNTKIPHFKSNDDVEKLTKALRKANVPDLNDPIDILINKEKEREKDYNSCNQSTYRCHHAIHAYTGVPCAAYLAQYRRNEQRSKGCLPQVGAPAGTSRIIESKKDEIGTTKTTYDPKKPLTVQLQHGSAKQQISLPTNFLDNSKKYQLTVSIQPSGASRLQGRKTKSVSNKEIKKYPKNHEEGPNSVRSAPELNKDAVQSADDGPNSVRSAPDLKENSTQKDYKNPSETPPPEPKEDSIPKNSENSFEQVSPNADEISLVKNVKNPSIQPVPDSKEDSIKENAENPSKQSISVAKKSTLQKGIPNNSLKPSPSPSTEQKSTPPLEAIRKKPILKKVPKET